MKKIISVAAATVMFVSAGVSASVPKAEWENFKTKFAAMSERVSALEAENQKLREASTQTVKIEDLAAVNVELNTLKEQSAETSWAERIKWKGDYRFRYETIDQQGRDDRERWRIRARPALVAKTSSTTIVGFGLATGGDDPVSSNQTLGNGSTSKKINLDLAYATWRPVDSAYVTAGIFSNPYYRVQKSQLIFDGDYRTEGMAVGWANDMFFATAGYNFIESDSSKSDYGVWGVQLGAIFAPVDGAILTASAGYFDVPTAGETAIFDDDFFGNSFVVDQQGVEVYEYDYNLTTASLKLALSVFDMPLAFYSDYVRNSDPEDFDTGYLIGLQLGNAKKRGSWQVRYQYEKLEANATLGLVTDSDFAGGGTDGKGSRIGVKYAIDDKWYVGATYFDNSTGFDLGDNEDYKRFQLDTGFKY
tara:strand:+ start:3680 stop:4936 length:1257 start_codon:yes stop_codon:yes gene_type:complete